MLREVSSLNSNIASLTDIKRFIERSNVLRLIRFEKAKGTDSRAFE